MGQGSKTLTEAYFSQYEELKMRANGYFEEDKNWFILVREKK
jgi:hypothetical protein